MQPLQPIGIPGVGFNGLNLQRANTPLGPEWCTRADNAVIDSAGRLAARFGYSRLNAAAVAGTAFETIHEYVQEDGTQFVVSAINNKIYNGTSVPADITGATAPTANKWQMVNFNNSLYMWQASHSPRVWAGVGNTAVLVAATGTLPLGNAAVAAFGRIWASDTDKQTIKYCALLDATKWATSDGAGSIDMRKVWTHGTDEIVALAAFGSAFVVFGKKHIVLWTDGQGSALGLDPVNMYVADVIENAGCVARDTVQLIGEGDIYFLSFTGVRSLRRTAQEKASPVNDLSGNVRDRINALTTDTTVTLSKLKAVYSPDFGFYLLSMPDKQVTFCFDTRSPLEDGSLRVTMWPGFYPTAMCRRVDNRNVLFGFGGFITKYATYLDHATPYLFDYRSGWISFSDTTRIALKEMLGKLFTPGPYTVGFNWLLDFSNTVYGLSRTFNVDTSSEYNVATYGASEYGGSSLSYRRPRVPLSGEASHAQFGMSVTINGYPLAIQGLTVYGRPTRFE